MSIFIELARLEALYATALISPLSCPRNREILRTKIKEMEEVSRSQQERRIVASKSMDPQDDMCLWEQEQVW